MRLLERILVATDLSSAADDAINMTAFLAKTFHSEVVLLHVMPPLPGVSTPSDLVKNQINQCLDSLRRKLVDDGITVSDTILVTGTPFTMIIDCAEQHDVNAIIIGSGEKTQNDQYRMGITAERLERRAQRPVLVVKRGTSPPVTRILCPVDFSDTSCRALKEAIHLAGNCQAQLTVLTVIEPLKSFLPQVVPVAEKAQQQYLTEQKALFHEFLSQFDLHDVSYNKLICEGQPHEEILKSVNEHEIDLLVMGSVGRTGVARILLGSVAEKVTRELPCSIMTVKEEDFVRLQLSDDIDDIRKHIERAEKLLDKRLAREALGEFRRCIALDPVYAPAWEGAAAAHERLGNEKEAEKCRQRSQGIIRSLWDRRIESEIRSQHWLWRKKGRI